MTGSAVFTEPRRWLIPGLILGAVLRAAALPLPGTGDTLVWKIWSYAASHDVTRVYGVGGSPPVHVELRWQNDAATVDYPPLSLGELGLAGRLYRHFHPRFEDSAWLDVCVKLPGLIFEIAFVALLLMRGRRWLGDQAPWAALAFWLNPLVLLNGSTLGYLDAEMAVPLTLAVVAAWRGRAIAAGVLAAVAILTKAQAIFVVPAIVITLAARGDRVRVMRRALVSALTTGAFVLLPFVVRGAGPNLAQAVERVATHDMVSGQAANIWWIFTWALRVRAAAADYGFLHALRVEDSILGITRVRALGYPNLRVVGLALVAVAIGWGCWRMRRATTLSRAAALSAWCAYSYAMLAAQVHENHWYAAVPLLGIAAAADRRYRGVFAGLSIVAALNLYLFYGLGSGWAPLTHRSWTGIDMSVLLSVVNVAVFVSFARRLTTDAPAAAPSLSTPQSGSPSAGAWPTDSPRSSPAH